MRRPRERTKSLRNSAVFAASQTRVMRPIAAAICFSRPMIQRRVSMFFEVLQKLRNCRGGGMQALDRMLINGPPKDWMIMDAINQAVITKLQERAELGAKKYGVTMDRTDLTDGLWRTSDLR
jgi:hypothetical protein